MKRLVGALGATILAVGGLAACGDDGDSSSADDGAIVVTEAWARPSPSMAGNGAVYLEVENTGDTDDAIVGAAVDASVAGATELHETVAADRDAGTDGDVDDMDESDDMDDMGGGAMSMRPVEAIPVPPGETVVLEPGGLHVMLLDLREALEEGGELGLTLTFENAGDVEVPVEIRTS